MEKSLNRVELKGNVGADPKIFVMEEGASVARFSMATNESYLNKKGEYVKETIWHNIVAWKGKNIPDFSVIKKGSFISLLGKLKPVNYVTKSGVERESYEIIAYNIKVSENWSG